LSPALDGGEDGVSGFGPDERFGAVIGFCDEAVDCGLPDRQSAAVVGDGGFAMLMAELTTAVANRLPIKIILLRNDSLAEVKFEQREIGNPEFGCDLTPIDFVAFARACGAEGFRCAHPEEVRPALQAALASPKPALVEAVVDANEKPTKPGDLKA